MTNEKVMTYQELEKFRRNYQSISELAPLVFKRGDGSLKGIAESMVRSFVIEKELLELGYNFSDDVINERISSIKQAQGISQDQLIDFLSDKGITFETYFGLIKKSLEYSQFSHKVIGPIVAITDQETKDYFEKRTKRDATTSVYDMVLITLPSNYKKEAHSQKWLEEQVANLSEGKAVDESLSGLNSTPLNNVSADGLNPSIRGVVNPLTPGQISSPFKLNGQWQIVLLKNRTEGEVSMYRNNKEQIRQELFLMKSQGVIDKWLEGKRKNYFIQVSL